MFRNLFCFGNNVLIIVGFSIVEPSRLQYVWDSSQAIKIRG